MPCGCGPTSHPDEKGASVMSFLMSDMRVYFAVCVFQSPSHSQHVGVVFEADPHQHPRGISNVVPPSRDRMCAGLRGADGASTKVEVMLVGD